MKSLALIIDDEAAIRRMLRLALETADFKVHETESGQQGLCEIAYKKPDVVILDLGLPDMDGMEVLKRLREWNSAPVLILSVRKDDDEKIQALDLGADDYVTKPFNTAELVARLRAILRRNTHREQEPIFHCDDLTVDYVKHEVRVKDKLVNLTATEYALLKILTQNAGKIVTHTQLLREVWGPKAETQSQYLRVYITHLRKKLEKKPSQYITTESRIGYRFKES